MKETQQIEKIFNKAYENGGLSKVCDLANEVGLKYAHCNPCETQTPVLNNCCAACGTAKK